MNTLYAKRQNKIYKIAKTDLSYQAWSQTFEECRDAFLQFANSQPEEIRGILYGYADSGRMMQQRLLNLACEHMRFPEEDSQ